MSENDTETNNGTPATEAPVAEACADDTGVTVATEDEKSTKTTEPPVTEQDKPKTKISVLETHGYKVGCTIGSGSYAIVKVSMFASFRMILLVSYEIVHLNSLAYCGGYWMSYLSTIMLMAESRNFICSIT
jgi:hypothetical protein